jgi:hypothetical protein
VKERPLGNYLESEVKVADKFRKVKSEKKFLRICKFRLHLARFLAGGLPAGSNAE